MMLNWKRISTLTLSLALLVSMMSGCAGGGGETAQPAESPASTEAPGAGGESAATEEPTAAGDPVTITIFCEFNTPNPPDPGNDVQKLIEEKTGTKLDFMWQSPGNWIEKLGVLLAAGDIPDLTKINEPSNPGYLQLASREVFWDVGPYVSDYPNLMEYPQEVWKNVRYQGKQYLIPSIRPMEGASFLAIRKDWLDKLEIPMPTNTGELYDALLAFKNNDMNGNGKTDTIPFSGRAWKGILGIFTMANYSSKYIDHWKVEDGHIVDAIFSEEMVQGIEYMQRMYADGLIVSEFAAINDSEMEEIAKSGNCGMTYDTVEGVFRSTEVCRTMDPAADFCAFDYIEGPLGKYAPRNSGVAGCYVIPKATVDEEKLKVILNFMDFGASEEGFELACWGIEGEHFTKDADGFRTQTEKGVSENIAQSTYGKVMARFDKYLWAIRTGMDLETYQRNQKIIDAREPISTPQSAFGLVSETYMKSGVDYGTKKLDIVARVIMGEPISVWTDYVETLKNDATYMAVTEELDAAYQERMAS